MALFALTVTPGGGSGMPAVVLVSLVALGLLGPYSYLAGAMAMDFGGKQGGAASSGLIDGIGYLGGALAGDSMARIATAFGWQKAFLTLGVVCVVERLRRSSILRSETNYRNPAAYPRCALNSRIRNKSSCRLCRSW